MQPVGNAVTQPLRLTLLYFASSFRPLQEQTKYLRLQLSKSGGSRMLLTIRRLQHMFLDNYEMKTTHIAL